MINDFQTEVGFSQKFYEQKAKNNPEKERTWFTALNAALTTRKTTHFVLIAVHAFTA